jgi:hypothetical protein
VDLNQISDRLEIEDLLIRYTRAIDSGDWDRLDEVFTPDAEIDYTESGGIADSYPAAKAWLAEVLPAFFPKRMHSLAQVDLAVDGDEASCTAYFHNPMVTADAEGNESVVELGGLYHHSLIRTPQGWRSRRLREELVWKRGL